MFFRKVLRSNKYCGFKIEVFSRSVVFFWKYWRKRSDPVFSETEKGEKLWYLLARHWNTLVLNYFGLENTDLPNRD